MADCCARADGVREGGSVARERVVVLARRDYRCLECGAAFALDDQPADARVACPACGSERTREHWESRVRNAGKVSSERFEELRDRPG